MKKIGQTRQLPFGLLVAACFLFSCARPPMQVAVPTETAPTPEQVETVHAVRLTSESRVASGFFVAPDTIATNVHVAALPGTLSARSADSRTVWRVEGVTAFDSDNDLVLLKVAGRGVPLTLADRDTVEIGDPVRAIGYPRGIAKIAEGHISDILHRTQRIQIRMALSGGTSGGPVLNRDGHVIGVITGEETPYGYAIPVNRLRALLNRSDVPEPVETWRKRPRVRAYVHAVQGQLHFLNQRYSTAITAFDAAIALNPQKADAYYNRGLAKFQLGEQEFALGNGSAARAFYEAGIKDSTSAIALNPADTYAYHNRAGGTFRLGQFKAAQGDADAAATCYRAALQDWTQVIALDPGLPDPYTNRGLTQATLGDLYADQNRTTDAAARYAAAVRDCTEAIYLNNETPDPYINRGYARYRLGKTAAERGNRSEARALYDSAVRDSTQAIQLAPRKVAAHGNRGTAKAAQGDFKGAIADFDAALRLQPNNASYLYERGRAKEQIGDTEGAESDRRKAAALDPEVTRD